MNSKGILFSLIALLLILSIMGLNVSIQNSRFSLDPVSEVMQLREVGKKFRDIERSLVELDLNTNHKRIAERGLPFTYSLTSPKQLVLSQEFPINPVSLAGYFDSIQGFRIFYSQLWQDSNRTDISLDINAPRDQNWGGTSSDVSFVLFPMCVRYRISKQSFWIQDASPTVCRNSFSPNALRRVDINVHFSDTASDYNVFLCNSGPCPQNPFDELNPLPFFSFTIVGSCPGCNIPIGAASGHFATTSDINVFLTCSGPSCHSKAATFLIGSMITGETDSTRAMDVNIGLDFNESIEGFRSDDFNFSVSSAKYSILHSNNPLLLPG